MNSVQASLPSYVPYINLITDIDLQRLAPIIKQLIDYIRHQHLALEYSFYEDHITGPCPVHNGWSRREFSINLNTGEWFCNGLCKHHGTARLLERILRSRQQVCTSG